MSLSEQPMAAHLPLRKGRLAGYSAYDFANSAFATTILAVLFNQYYAREVAGGEAGVIIGGQAVPGATVYSWLIAVSMSLVVLTGPVLGNWADQGGRRIRFLAAFWLPGVLATAALGTVGPGEWLWGGLLFGVSYYCFSASSIFYNALLPEVGHRSQLGRVSGIAWGFGYVGGALLLGLNLLMLQYPEKLGFEAGRFSIHDCFVSVAIWWFVFTLPTLWTFREMNESSPSGPKKATSFRASVGRSRQTLGQMIRERNLTRFFFAYLIYNDGVQTVVAMASIFGAQELGMDAGQLILFFLLIQLTAFLGAMILGPLADRWNHRAILLVCVGAWTLLTTWGYAVGIFGDALREYWVLGGIAGIFLGGIQTCSRSMIVQWIPEHRESEFFGFFSIMTRLAAIFGPAVYGAIVWSTGSLRLAILAVTGFFIVGGLLLYSVRPDQIEEERSRLAGNGP